jgi:hypothetical protein
MDDTEARLENTHTKLLKMYGARDWGVKVKSINS